MKRIVVLVSVCCCGILAKAQSPDFAWARVIGNSGVTVGALLAMDASGNSYVAGAYSANLTLGSTTLVHSGPGGASQFLAKFDAAGQPVWAQKINMNGVQDSNNPDKLLADSDGNVYLTGTFFSGQPLDTMTIPVVPQGKGYGLAKFGPDGHIRWFRMADTPDLRIGTSSSLEWDPQGNLCLTGLFNTAITFPPGITLTNTGSTAGVDAFRVTYTTDGQWVAGQRLGVVNPSFNPNVNYPPEQFKPDAAGNLYRFTQANNTLVKYDPQGNILQTKPIASAGASMELNSLAVDPAGNVFLGGWFYNGSTLTLESTSIPKFGSNTYPDALLVKLSAANGYALDWVNHHQYIHNDSYNQVRTDALGNVYVVGQYAPAVGDGNARLAKYTNAGALLWEQIVIPGAGGPGAPLASVMPQNIVQARNGGNILMMGYFKERIYFNASNAYVNPAGVYKVFVAQYGVCATPVPVVEASAAQFCPGDSVLLSATSPNPYVWNTGDSAQSIYAGLAGPYYVTAVEDSECYALSEAIHLTEAPVPGMEVTQNGAVLAAVESGATYQWLDCDHAHTPITGATLQLFTATSNGHYAVRVTNSAGCSDTSACFAVNGLAVNEQGGPGGIMLFPNPTTDYIQISGNVSGATIRIFDLSGRQVFQKNGVPSVDVSALAPGTYGITVETKEGQYRSTFVKQ